MPVYALGPHTPEIDPESWIAPNAVVIGQVKLSKNASIWWNCTVRGDTDRLIIGENSNIQDGSVLHTNRGIELRIGNGVTVGHGSMLHGCTNGDGSLIGIGAVVLNHAVIGKDSLVAAHTLVPEGKIFPDRALILGSPGKMVRELTDEEIARNRASAERYVINWQHYRQTLRLI